MRKNTAEDRYSVSCDLCGCEVTFSSYEGAAKMFRDNKAWQISTSVNSDDLCPACKGDVERERKLQSLKREQRGLIETIKEKEQRVMELWQKKRELGDKIRNLK